MNDGHDGKSYIAGRPTGVAVVGFGRVAKHRGKKLSRRAAPPARDDDRVAWITRAGLAIILCATVALVVVVRLRFAGVPLERDEGEYAYAGQLILKGVPPYTLAYNMKFPGTYYAYAALMAVFGQTAWGIRVGLLCVHLATAGLVFALGRRVAGALAGGVGAVAFVMLALDRWSMGLFAHATHFVLLPVLAGLWLLERAARSGRGWQFLAAGALMGLAVVMKQQALPFAVLAIGLAAWNGQGANEPVARSWWQRGLLAAAGVAAAFGLLIMLLAAQGVLGRFWFWTFDYASAYVAELPVSMAAPMLAMAWGYVTRATAWWWYAGVIGLVLLFVTTWPNTRRRFLAAWFLAAASAIMPGFFFRPHYFILLMPAVAVLAGITIASLDGVLARRFSAPAARVTVLVGFTVFLGAYVQRTAHDLFDMTDTELIRSVYADNPFLEAPEIGRYLAAHTKPDDRIAVLGSEPEIFFYANRVSATGYIYMYPLLEAQPYVGRMRDEMRQEVEATQPSYLVVAGIPGSWGARPDSDLRLVEWANRYATNCYDMVGMAEVDPRRGAAIRWDAAVVGYQPQSNSRISVFRRKPGAACRISGGP